MSYDLRIWSSGQISEDSLLAKADYKLHNDFFLREGKGWQVIISRSYLVEPEDIPDSIMQALPGISFMTEISIEPISAPEKIKNETLRLCNALAKEMKGIVEDPQVGTAKVPTGVKKVIDVNFKCKNRPLVSLIWFFDDVMFYQSKKIGQFIDLLEKYMPDALPRRYGEFEPPQYKYAETGKVHLIDFLKRGSSPVWYATKPFTHMHFSIPHIEKEKAEIIKNDLINKDINPQSYYGAAMRKFRSGYIELQLLQDIFIQPDWNLAVKRLFIEIAKLLKPFYSEIICEQLGSMTGEQYIKMEKEGLFRSWWWRGIPRDLGYAVVLDKQYISQWEQFKMVASCISDNLYMADCFGEPGLKNVSSKIGAVPESIVAPKDKNKMAAFFPFQSALSFLNPDL